MTTQVPDDPNIFFPIPSDNPELFYRALIGGVLTPGAIPPDGLDDWDIIADWDVKKGKGNDDAVITDQGNPSLTGKLKYQVWRYGTDDNGQPDPTAPNDFRDDALFVLLLRKARQDGKALDIAHPIPNQQGVFSVVYKRIGALKHQGGGLWTREIEFLKWVEQPKSGGGTPKSSEDKMTQAREAAQHNIDVANKFVEEVSDPNFALKAEFKEKAKEAADPDEGE